MDIIARGNPWKPQNEIRCGSSLDKLHANPYNNVVHISGYSADGSALGSGPRGRGFDSRYSDQKRKIIFG